MLLERAAQKCLLPQRDRVPADGAWHWGCAWESNFPYPRRRLAIPFSMGNTEVEPVLCRRRIEEDPGKWKVPLYLSTPLLPRYKTLKTTKCHLCGECGKTAQPRT